MPYSYNTCRFCHKVGSDRMVKYGTRHYAHHACYLNAGKQLTDLRDWQIVQFPYLLAKEHGLLDVVEAAYDREQTKHTQKSA